MHRLLPTSAIVAVTLIAAGSAAYAQRTDDRRARAGGAPHATSPNRGYAAPTEAGPLGKSGADSPYAKIRGGLSQGFAPIDTQELINRSQIR